MNFSYLKSRYNEIFIVEPNDLGHPLLTKIYKVTTGYLKTMPFLYVIPMSFCVAILLYVAFGLSVVRLVSLLQNGF